MSTWQTLRKLLNPDVVELTNTLWQLRQTWFRPADMYEVLDYDVRLELLDAGGNKAVYEKHQRVRFCQDNVIAFYDQAFGDGEIFSDYQCSPGIAVDRFQEDYRYRVLISLRETKDRGDEETFHIRRTIRNGFAKKTGYFQTRLDHRTHKLKISLVFPPERSPKWVRLTQQKRGHTMPLGPQHTHTLPDGRTLVEWCTDHPRRHETYNLRWRW